MEEPTLRFLSDCGLPVRRSNPRQYSAGVGSGGAVQAVFQRAADIPQQLSMGLVDAGITGFDIYSEHLGETGDVVVAVEDLGFARCSLVLAVPEAWLDVSSFADLADVAADFRRRGRSLRIATKFPRLVRRFLLQHGLSAHTLVEGSGALELAPSLGYADIIADINETGTTLRANRLKQIEGGTILQSQACLLIGRQQLQASPAKREHLRGVLELIEAHQRAGEVVSLTANIEGPDMDTVAVRVLERRDLAGARGPTISRVYDPEAAAAVFAVTVVVPSALLSAATDHLRRCGGSTITVHRPVYLFDQRSSLYARLSERLDAGAKDDH
jgi:ATP phosphoribosyltransferase